MPGVYALGRRPAVVYPLGGGHDDTPRIQAALVHGDVRLVGGVYTIATRLEGVSQRRLGAEGATHLVSTLAAGVPAESPTRSPLFCGPGGGSGLVTTLAADAAPGDRTIVVTDPVPAGATVQWAAGDNRLQVAEVLSASGAGPCTLTLSDLVAFPAPAGGAVGTITCVTDFHIEANGARLSGTGINGIELSRTLRCSITGLTVDGAGFSGIVASIDIGSRHTVLRDCTLDAGGTCPVVFSAEGAIDCAIRDCALTASRDEALWAWQSPHFIIHGCQVERSGQHGVQISGAPIGAVRVIATTLNDCGGAGVYVDGAADLVGISATRCVHGVRVGGGLVAIDGLTSRSAINQALRLDGGHVVARAVDSSGTWGEATIRVTGGASLDLVGLRSSDIQGIWVDGGGVAVVRSAAFSPLAGGATYYAAAVDGGGRLELTEATIDFTGAGSASRAIWGLGAGTLELEDVTLIGSAAGSTGVLTEPGAAVAIRYDRCDFSAAATPYAVDAAATETHVATAAGH